MKRFIFLSYLFIMVFSVCAAERSQMDRVKDEVMARLEADQMKKKNSTNLFKIDPRMRTVDDAPGSHLIRDFESALRKRVQELKQRLDFVKQNKDSQRVAVQQLSTPAISPNALLPNLLDTREIDQTSRDIEECLEFQTLLPKLLSALLDPPSAEIECEVGFILPCVNYDLLTSIPLKDYEGLENYDECADTLILNCKLEGRIPRTLTRNISGIHSGSTYLSLNQLTDTKKQMNKYAEIIYDYTTGRDPVDPQAYFVMTSAESMTKQNKTKPTDFLWQEIEELNTMAQKVIIPSFQPRYLCVKIISAFQKELDVHQAELKAYRASIAPPSVDNP